LRLNEHADHTEKLVGIRAEDIHKWIDGFFDLEGFDNFIRMGQKRGFDPYSHRKHRHCIEALEDAYSEFEGKYSKDQIKQVFETHLRDDYNGYIPSQKDFEDGKFEEKYHENESAPITEAILSKSELSEYFSGKMYQAEKDDREQRRRLGFWLHILTPTTVALGLFVACIFWIIIPQFETNLINQKKIMIRELTASAVSIISDYQNLVERGELSLDEAKIRAARQIGAMRYGPDNKEYFWITDGHPTMIMHPYRPDLNGQDLSNYSDKDNKSGKLLFVEFANLVDASNEGYLEYFWQNKDDVSRVVPKLSYVKGVEHWNWIVGTGIYLSDVHEEIEQLSKRVLLIFAFITIGLVFLLLYIIRQSRAIDQKRQRAESGLIEAKDRYRALVEASNEGYVLELDGEHIYSNLSFQKLTGFNEEATLETSIWQQILPDTALNAAANANLQRVFSGKSVRGEVEARLLKKNQESVDVVLRISRIFFSQKNGHVISLRPIVRQLTPHSGFSDPAPTVEELLLDLKQSQTEGHLVRTLNRLSLILSQPIESDANLQPVRKFIAQTYHTAVETLIRLDLEKHPELPIDSFSFFSLGSAAREEMTLFSDQDSALVFDTPDSNALEDKRTELLQFTNRICKMLDSSGYPFCHGGIMASNPKWCLSSIEWCTTIEEQFKEATPQSIREFNIFVDLYPIFGNKKMVSSIQDHIFDMASKHPQFLRCFAQNCLHYKVPINALGLLRTEIDQGDRSINIKDCLNLIILYSRIYSLKHGIRSISTTDRLDELMENGHIQKQTYAQMSAMFDLFWKIRFNNQIKQHSSLRKVNDRVPLDSINDEDTQKLKEMLGKLYEYQSQISFDFLGVDRSIATQ
jgi:CBS domain-containing protein